MGEYKTLPYRFGMRGPADFIVVNNLKSPLLSTKKSALCAAIGGSQFIKRPGQIVLIF